MDLLNIIHDACTIQLTRNKNTLVDVDDFFSLDKFLWYSFKSDRPGSKGREHWYARKVVYLGNKKSKHIGIHQYLLGSSGDIHVDHRNSDGLDNRRKNIRVCTKQQNKQNVCVSWGRSKYKGVHYDKARCLWSASIMLKYGRRWRIGRYHTETEAANAYDEAAIEEYGEFSCTNSQIHGSLV